MSVLQKKVMAEYQFPGEHTMPTDKTETHQKDDKIALPPLLMDNAHSPVLIKHVMKLVKDGIRYLNPGQTPVIAMDQPLYFFCQRNTVVFQRIWREYTCRGARRSAY